MMKNQVGEMIRSTKVKEKITLENFRCARLNPPLGTMTSTKTTGPYGEVFTVS